MHNIDKVEKIIQLTIGTLKVISIACEVLEPSREERVGRSDDELTVDSEEEVFKEVKRNVIDENFPEMEEDEMDIFLEGKEDEAAFKPVRSHSSGKFNTNPFRGKMSFSFEFEI